MYTSRKPQRDETHIEKYMCEKQVHTCKVLTRQELTR